MSLINTPYFDFQYGSFPLEIKYNILLNLPYKDLLNYCGTSKTNRNLLKDKVFWRMKTKKDFGKEISELEFLKEEPNEKIVLQGGGDCHSYYRYCLYKITYYLEHLVKTGQFSLIEKYVNLGANLNPKEFKQSPLVAFLKSTSSYYKYLPDYPLSIPPNTIRSKLLWFLKMGSDPNACDISLNTPLMICEDIKCAKILLDFGANPKAKTVAGTPIIMYIRDVSLMRVLLDYGADPNDQDINGLTSLWYAIIQMDEYRVRLLLEYGAKVDIKSKHGDTCIDLIEKMVLSKGSYYNKDKLFTIYWLIVNKINQ